MGELIAERFELEEQIGTGGMSTVFRARDRLLERNVALKILLDHHTHDEEYVERFRREARAAAQLSHPNIVTVIDRGESGGRQYIVFEYVEGENLKELVARSGPLPVRKALTLAVQVGRALAVAHEHGVVHRDVKPQNVLLGNGEAKVTDFGIARSVDVTGTTTQTGTVMGTSDYIAPEQASGLGSSEQSDVYSLGAVIFELLTGEVPFPGENFIAVAMRHVNDPVPSVLAMRPDVPLRLEAAIRRAMAKDPRERFATMADFVGELETCLRDLGSPDRDVTLIRRGPASSVRSRRRRPRGALRLLGALAALVIAGAIAGGIFVAVRHGGTGVTNGLPAPAAATPVELSAVASYDPPPGDGTEHPERISLAADHNPSTYWETEHYGSVDFGNLKQGVGLVVAAPSAVRLPRLKVTTDTPGFTAEVKAGSSPGGPFDSVSSPQTVAGSTTFALHVAQPRRYYLIWITKLPSDTQRADLNEVSAGQ